MTIKFATDVCNARNDAIETVIGASAVLKFRSGSAPANCAASDTGTVLATLNLPSDWMGASSSGVKAKSGTWEDLTPDNNGTVGHFRIYDSGGTCKMQGSVTASGGGGDMIVSSTSFVTTGSVTVNTFSLTDAGL